MRLLVVGAGGHAKVVIDAAEIAGFEIAGVVGQRTDVAEVLGHRVLHSAEGIDADGFIVAIGDNRTRASYFERYRAAGLEAVSVVHPSAVVARSARIGAGVFVAAGAIVNPLADIGDDAILNTGCVVEHDVRVGAHALVGPTACLCGGSQIGEGVLLGAGSTVRPLRTVGAWSVCGAGAAIVADLAADTVYVGVPARPVRPIGAS